MKPTATIGIVTLFLFSTFVFGDDPEPPVLKVRPIHFVSSDTIPLEVDRRVLPTGLKRGFEIYYLVEGKEIAGFESLTLESIKTPKGVDLSRSWNGAPGYQAGPSPQVSTDRKHCVFSLIVPRNQFGKVEQLDINGYATLLVGSKREAAQIELTEATEGKKTAGPFSVTVTRTSREPMPPAAANKDPAASVPPDNTESLRVDVQGPIPRLIEAVFVDGDRERQSQSSGDKTHLTFHLPIPISGKVRMTVRSWAAITPVHVMIGKPGDLMYYNQLKEILNEIRKERAQPTPNFGPISEQAKHVSREVATVMKNQASRDFPAKQGLLWAARDELPRMLQRDLTTESEAELSFAARLDDVARELRLK